MSGQRVVVVGAGHAGGTFVALLRRAGFDGSIVLVGSEVHPPYQRPPLSKFLDLDAPTQWLHGTDVYANNGIATMLGETVAAIDRETRTVRLRSGTELQYDILVLATGVEPRRLSVRGGELAGVQTLRTLEDAHSLRRLVHTGQPLAIIGGGYIGLEVAAAARARNVDVTIIEREDRVLARVASPALSKQLTQRHRAQGTRILTEVETSDFVGDKGRISAVNLTDSRIIPCAAVLVGVGASARDTLARVAGLECTAAGIVVDEQAQTSDPSILALGDVTVRPMAGMPDGRMRFESIPSAVEQAKRAVDLVMGTPTGNREVPWSWSDQFDLKIKTAGIVNGTFETVTRGDPLSSSFALYHHREGNLIAVETVNSPRDFMAGKRILHSGERIDPVRLSDPTADLRSFATA